jgi:hypothetical protein
MLLPNKILSKKQGFDARYFLIFFPNIFKMRQSLIAFKFLVEVLWKGMQEALAPKKITFLPMSVTPEQKMLKFF